MAADLSMSKAQLGCIAIETYLYGLYTVLAALTMWLLFTRHQRNRTSKLLILHTLLMFILCTGHVVVTLEYIFTIFLYHNAATEGDIIPTRDDRFLAFFILLLINCIVGDVVVIWRAWVLWGRSKKAIVAPSLCWLGSIVAFAGSVDVISRPGGLQLADGLDVSPWIATFLVLTFLTNFTAVVAISYRYWLYRKEVINVLGRQSKNFYAPSVFILIIESGSLYCVTLAAVLAAYVSGSRTLDMVLLGSVSILTAMYPSLIVVLVCLRVSQRDHLDKLLSRSGANHSTGTNIAPASSCAFPGARTQQRFGRTQRAIEIRVEELATYTTNDIELSLQVSKEPAFDHKHASVEEGADRDRMQGRVGSIPAV